MMVVEANFGGMYKYWAFKNFVLMLYCCNSVHSDGQLAVLGENWQFWEKTEGCKILMGTHFFYALSLYMLFSGLLYFAIR